MPGQEYFSDASSRIKDIEEKQRLLKERTLLIGQNVIEQRELLFKELQELKKTMMLVKDEQTRMKEFLQRISEQIENSARKEELMIIQRQLDMLK